MRSSKSFTSLVTTVMFSAAIGFTQTCHVDTSKSACTVPSKQLKPQSACPVMGGKINRNVYADFEGKRVYFCCKGCIPEFNKEPAKYMKKLEVMGQSAETLPALKPQTTCPVMGGAIDKKLYVNYKGKRIYVCCGDCLAKVKKNPEKYLKKLETSGQEAETVPNIPAQTGKDTLKGK